MARGEGESRGSGRRREGGGNRRRRRRRNNNDNDNNGPDDAAEETAPSVAADEHGDENPRLRGGRGGGGRDDSPPHPRRSASGPAADDASAHSTSLAELQRLCDAASEGGPDAWDAIRRWLRVHSADDARLAAERRGDYETTPLHLACRNCPPLDVVNMLLTASPRTVELADSFGWLPLHYACANEASEEVLVTLAEQYPASKVAVDKRKRTPLHFALGHTERPSNVATVLLLSGTGAALMADENGMLPLHYACAYGATEEALRVLTDENIQTIIATDNRGRTPLHFALGNADRPASPGVVGLLLSQDPAVVNSIDLEGNLPIHLLATRTQSIKDEERGKRANCLECFALYLEARPRATADLLTALQSLPDWLREPAVLSPVVQKILNIKISQRFPTAVTIMDLFCYIIVVVSFQLSIDNSIKLSIGETDEVQYWWLAFLYFAVLYFIVREVVQALSLASLGLFSTWVWDLSNWLDLVYIFLVLAWAIIMSAGALTENLYEYKAAAAISLALFYGMILMFLKGMKIGFAVFVRGVTYVVKRLAPFMMTLLIVIIMFAQIFWTLFRMSPECQLNDGDSTDYIQDPQYSFDCENSTKYTDNITGVTYYNGCEEQVESCEPTSLAPFCNRWLSVMKITTMLLGEVNESYFMDQPFAKFFFVLFMFTCVIVLANVLIAIVTDSYSVIQNERAALVFWSNRLDFVAEMDVISNNFSRKGRGESRGVFDTDDATMAEIWKKVMYLFDDDMDDHGVMSVEFIIYSILRIFAALVIIPSWIFIGLITFGLMWPPQVREKLLTSQMTGGKNQFSGEVNRLNQVNTLKENVASLQEELKLDMEKGRDELYLIKAVLDSTKTEIHTEMNDLKEIVTDLFELLGST